MAAVPHSPQVLPALEETSPRESEALALHVDLDPLAQAALDALPAHVALLDRHGTIVAVNAAWHAFAAANGGSASAEVGANYLDVCRRAAEDDVPLAAAVLCGLEDVLADGRATFESEYPCDTPSRPHWFSLRASGLAVPGPARVIVQHSDVTTHKRAADDARQRKWLLDAVDASVIALDRDGRVTSWNTSAESLYGWSAAEAMGRSARDLVVPDAGTPSMVEAMRQLRRSRRWEGTVELCRRDGTRFPAYVRNAALEGPEGEVVGFVGVSIDLTERLHEERSLRSARGYMSAVAASMGDGLCTLDQDGRVVYINPRGEELLGRSRDELVGQDLHRVAHHSHPDGTPYPHDECPLVQARRAGGAATADDDAFIRSDGSVLPVRQVLTPFETDDGVGGFVLVFSDITAQKREQEESARRLRDFGWIERIRAALDLDRFVLHAQPIVELATGETVQHELLIRMLGPRGTFLPPNDFLPIAEQYGLIGEIDRWVIVQAIALAAGGRSVELNLSAHSLSDPTLYDYVAAELDATGADPALLVFELTETALLRDEDAAQRFVTAIVARGCRLALDDFGTGYGCFAYLKRLPVSYLKIDIEFVRDFVSEPASRQVVDAVVNLARGFGIETVAEGVEDAATQALLAEHGVDYVQGYHLGRPAPLEIAFPPEV